MFTSRGVVRENMPRKKILKQIEANIAARASANALNAAKQALGGQQPKRKRNKKKKNMQASTSVSAPISIQKMVRTNKPNIKYNGQCVSVAHREYLQDINGSDVFSVLTFSVNPGIYTTFPWLSQMAILYESYKFKTLKFIYEPACPSTTQGSVMLAIDFDAADVPPSSKVQLMAYKYAVRSPAWEAIAYRSDLSDLLKFGVQRYVRNGPTTGDIKTYDIGNLQFAVSNFTTPSTFVGELYVEYEVEFYTPQLQSTLPATSNLIVIPNGSTTFSVNDTYYLATGINLVTYLNTNLVRFNFTGRLLIIPSDVVTSMTLAQGTGSFLGTRSTWGFGTVNRFLADVYAGNTMTMVFPSTTSNFRIFIVPYSTVYPF